VTRRDSKQKLRGGSQSLPFMQAILSLRYSPRRGSRSPDMHDRHLVYRCCSLEPSHHDGCNRLATCNPAQRSVGQSSVSLASQELVLELVLVLVLVQASCNLKTRAWPTSIPLTVCCCGSSWTGNTVDKSQKPMLPSRTKTPSDSVKSSGAFAHGSSPRSSPSLRHIWG
jgi:hypothetical protein